MTAKAKKTAETKKAPYTPEQTALLKRLRTLAGSDDREQKALEDAVKRRAERKAELQRLVKALKKTGLVVRQIALAIDRSTSTVQDWLKPPTRRVSPFGSGRKCGKLRLDGVLPEDHPHNKFYGGILQRHVMDGEVVYEDVDLLERDREFLGAIGMDPYSNAEANVIVRAQHYRSLERGEDGNLAPWIVEGMVKTIRVNAPWEAATIRHALKRAIEVVEQHGVEVIFVAPRYPDSDWLADARLRKIGSIGNLYFRPHFLRPDGGKAMPAGTLPVVHLFLSKDRMRHEAFADRYADVADVCGPRLVSAVANDDVEVAVANEDVETLASIA